MISKNLRVTLFFLFGSLLLQAQSPLPRLGIAPSGLHGFPSQVMMGDTIDFYLFVQNTQDSSSYTGEFQLLFKNDSLPGALGAFDPDGSLVTHLDYLDSIPVFVYRHVISPQFYVAGTDIIIIWPSALGLLSDSIIMEVEVLLPIGMTNDAAHQPLEQLQHRYSATTKQLSLELPTTDGADAKVFNLQGQELLSHRFTGNTNLVFDSFPSGVYSVLVQVANRTRIIRVVR